MQTFCKYKIIFITMYIKQHNLCIITEFLEISIKEKFIEKKDEKTSEKDIQKIL